MTRSAQIAVAAALLLAGTSLATAKSRGAAGAHGKPFHPGINETTSRPTAADPDDRLADPYYGYSDTSRPTVADPYYRLSDSVLWLFRSVSRLIRLVCCAALQSGLLLWPCETGRLAIV